MAETTVIKVDKDGLIRIQKGVSSMHLEMDMTGMDDAEKKEAQNRLAVIAKIIQEELNKQTSLDNNSIKKKPCKSRRRKR